MPFATYLHEYHNKIQSGEIIAGELIKLAYQMIIDGLKNKTFIYNAKTANKAIKFIENFCHHSEGRTDLLVLELWQKAAVCAIFGIVDEDNIRIWREVFLVVGRKNGKTLFASAIMAYMAYIDGEYGAKIYCLAPKLEQSTLVYDKFHQMILQEEELGETSKKRRSDIYIEQYNTSIRPLAFSAKKSDGFNPQLVINDEVSSWPGARGLKQYEVMKSALGSRKQPLILSITTAGYENEGIYDELMKRSTRVLKGGGNEKRLLPLLYIIDDPEKWCDIEELKKANPNYNVSIQKGFLEDEIIIAKESASKYIEFLIKYCNVKQNSSVAAFTANLIQACAVNYKLEDFKNCYAVGGVDLSQTTDLTSACVIIEVQGVLYSITRFFMPARRYAEAEADDNVRYDIFVKKGILIISGENYVNYKDVLDWFVMLRKEYKIYTLKIGYDRYSAQYLIDDLEKAKFQTDDVHQGENLTPVLREFEGTLKDGNYKICDMNGLLMLHFLNVAYKHNLETRRFRPIKIEQRARIDGFVSNIDALTVRQKWYKTIGMHLKNSKKQFCTQVQKGS